MPLLAANVSDVALLEEQYQITLLLLLAINPQLSIRVNARKIRRSLLTQKILTRQNGVVHFGGDVFRLCFRQVSSAGRLVC